MLGKRWLNRYESTEVRGSAIERSRNRQRKLDGITAWYFDSVMESLSLMLQVALLLLGCALSRYLWGIDTTVALVVLGITSLGVILLLFIVIAGATTESCPYQTPGSQLLRSLGRIFWNTLVVVTSTIGKPSRRPSVLSGLVQIITTPGGLKEISCVSRKTWFPNSPVPLRPTPIVSGERYFKD